MGKQQPKAKTILTAVVSTGFLLSFVGNAYAAVSYPIKAIQTRHLLQRISGLTAGFMRDKAGNLIQGSATAPVKPKQ